MPNINTPTYGKIILYEGVPIVKNKAHRILLSSENDFLTGLNTQYKKIEYNATLTWDERQRRTVKLQGLAIDYNACNYMMIASQDSTGNYVNLYAFIDEIKFVSINMFELTYTLDLFTSYIYKMSFNKVGYVIRHHVNNDTIGVNKVPENIETGAYLHMNLGTSQDLNATSIVVSTTLDLDLQTMSGNIYGGVFTGGGLLGFARTETDLTILKKYLEDLNTAGKIDSILNIFITPSIAISYGSDHKVQPLYTARDSIFTVDKTYTQGTYTPRNNKLYTKPYCYLLVSNNQGELLEYEYDLFNSIDYSKCNFKIYAVPTTGECVSCYPQSYGGLPENYLYPLGLGSYPSVNWYNDQYANWLAQTQNVRTQSAINSFTGGLIGAIAGIASGNMGQAVTAPINAINEINMLNAQQKDNAIQPNLIRGSSSFGNINVATYKKVYQAYHVFLQPEFAKIIDNKFTAYGYSILSLTTPNFYGRSNWNYVQVADYPIIGAIPSEAKNEIRTFIEAGVTLWHTWDMGNYNNPNNIL